MEEKWFAGGLNRKKGEKEGYGRRVNENESIYVFE